MLSNSVVAATLGASYVMALVLQLNPTLSLQPRRLLPLVLTVGVFYAAHLTVIFYVWLVVRQLFARELFSPAWTSVAVLSWLGAAAAAAGAALMWANLRTFSLVLTADTVDEMARGMLALVASASLFVVVGLLRAHFWARNRAVWAFMLVLVAAGSIAAPVALRGRASVPVLETRPIDASLEVATAERPSRVTLLAIDAGSLDLITGAAADGRLPNFGRVLDAGAVMHLATLHPTSAEAVWTAVATGKLPPEKRRPIGPHLSLHARRRARAVAARLLLCARAGALRARLGGAAHFGRAANPAVLEHSERPRHSCRRRRMAADAPGACRARLSGERRVSAPDRDALGDRGHLVGVPARHEGRRGGCRER